MEKEIRCNQRKEKNFVKAPSYFRNFTENSTEMWLGWSLLNYGLTLSWIFNVNLNFDSNLSSLQFAFFYRSPPFVIPLTPNTNLAKVYFG